MAVPAVSARELLRRWRSTALDATNEDSIIALVNTVVSNHKKADILVNAQGYNKKFSLFDFPMDVMADMMNVNVIGVAMACKHFGKVMKENGYGRIINLSSVPRSPSTPSAPPSRLRP